MSTPPVQSHQRHQSHRLRIGIDLGGTKIEGIALAPDGTPLARIRVPTPQGDYDATVRAVADLVARLETDAALETGDQATVGVGIPGTISPQTGLVKNANSLCLIGNALDRDLEAAIGRPVRLANDANCFAVSEAHDGAAKGAHVAFAVIIGTGVGSGLAVDARPIEGVNAIAGEWGHNPLPWPQVLDGIDERPGPTCYCGLSGCIETFLSGPGLARDHEAHTGEALSTHDIVERAQAGDPGAVATMDRYVHRLARALATILNVLDPDVIVLGGGLSNIAALYDAVPAQWTDWAFTDVVTTKLVPNVHGDSSGVRGAAWLWD